MQYLNLGCGARYHPAWINVDVVPQGPDVIAHDLTKGIPLPNTSCDVVYHSNLLEHMRRADAQSLMAECYRVLRPGGVMRVAVPDLEQICHLYLKKLNAALSGDVQAGHDYEWIMLELYDQVIRECAGGDMLAWLRQDPLPNEAFVYERIGEEGRGLVRALKDRASERHPLAQRSPLALLAQPIRDLSGSLRRRVVRLLVSPSDLRALAIGRFRLAGEVHHWMYDRYSLARLMRSVGFAKTFEQTAIQSQIPDWSSFHLDVLPNGAVIKPDSFFMEATKPEEPSS
jgi:SAM-dependent methyltransferase